jgi:LPXTG-site transpeptidase (sortase) family protein
MINSLRIIVAGLLVAGLSFGTWSLTGPPETAGNALVFENALAPPSPGGPAAAPGADSPTDGRAESGVLDLGRRGGDPRALRFTVGEGREGTRRIPARLTIPALSQDAPIIEAGVEDNGEMEVPDNVTEVAWYKFGSSPGEAGSAVLAAHVDLAGRGPGVFFDLRSLEPGSLIYIHYTDGTTQAFRAEARTVYEKSALPTDAIFSRSGPAVLTLITCGGDFNRSIRSYERNVVVYAVPIQTAKPNPV